MKTSASNDCLVCSVRSIFQETELVKEYINTHMSNFTFKAPTPIIHGTVLGQLALVCVGGVSVSQRFTPYTK